MEGKRGSHEEKDRRGRYRRFLAITEAKPKLGKLEGIMKAALRHSSKLLLGLMAWLLVSGAYAATLPQRREYLARRSLAYGQLFYSASDSLLLDESLRPDVTRFSPGYVAAALWLGQQSAQAAATLQAILQAQDNTPDSPTYGLFPAQAGLTAPSLSATCQLLPVLTWILEHSQMLSPELQEQTRVALERAYQAIRGAGDFPEHPYLQLTQAAALATAGRVLGHKEGMVEAQAAVSAWLQGQLQRGCWQGHGPSAESLRAGALAWVAQASGEPSADTWAALRLGYMDLFQRVQPGSQAVAGAASFVQPADYARGGELSRYLIYLWAQGQEPAIVRPSAMYFATCEFDPQVAGPESLSLAAPRMVSTLGTEAAGFVRTDTYVTDLFSLGTMSGWLGRRAVPLMITLGGNEERPTAYLFPSPAPARAASVQQHNLALMSVEFDQIGRGERTQAYLYGILGPRGQIKRVLVNGRPWPGQPAALAQGSVVAVQRGGLYLGIRLLYAGPALREQQSEVTKPGVLRWPGEQADAELELLIYARKRSYQVTPPIDNLIVVVLVAVEPQAAFENLEAFSRHLRAGQWHREVTASTERKEREESPSEEFLTQYDPKSKADYEYLKHLLHTVTYESDGIEMELQEDLATGKVLAQEVGGEPMAATGPWQSPGLSLPWDVAAARACLTAGGQ